MEKFHSGIFRATLVTFCALTFFVGSQSAFADTAPRSLPHALLYVTNSKSAIQSLREHIDSMDIIAPQTYASTPTGKLLGSPRAEVLQLARDAGARVMPLVVNQNFSQSGMHAFLESEVAQNKLLSNLIAEAKLRGYIGFQYDFEHMQATDRDLYSAFVQKSAPLFHNAGLQLSVALAPRHSDFAVDYGAGSWDNWTGAFDYSSIGGAADFVSVMAYDDSKSAGPAASLPWVEDVLTYTLARIPAGKISLGVPFYAWINNMKTGELDHIRGYSAIASLLETKSYMANGWSDDLGVPWITYNRGGKRLIAWYENEKSFQKKLALVRKNNLAGFSAWALGLEDPKVWDVVVAMRAPQYGLAAK